MDAEAGAYFNTFMALAGWDGIGERWLPDDSKSIEVNGFKLERWFAKTLVNTIYAKYGKKENTDITRAYFRRGFLEYVFKGMAQPEFPFGLWSFPADYIPHDSEIRAANAPLTTHTIWRNHFSEERQRWGKPQIIPCLMRIQLYPEAPIHIGLFNLLPAGEILNEKYLSDLLGVELKPEVYYRPSKIGFDLSEINTIGDDPDCIFSFDWEHWDRSKAKFGKVIH